MMSEDTLEQVRSLSESTADVLPPSEPWDFEESGLVIKVLPFNQLPKHIAALYAGWELSPSTLVGKMDFKPSHVKSDATEAEKMNHNIDIYIKILEDLQKFFHEIDGGQSMPDFLIGITNFPMARGVRRFGFERKPVSILGNETILCSVLGEPAIVRGRVESIIAKTNGQGQKRLERLHERLITRGK